MQSRRLLALALVFAPSLVRAEPTNPADAIEAWRVEWTYVRANHTAESDGFITGAADGPPGLITVKTAASKLESEAFDYNLLEPPDDDSEWHGFRAGNHAWSESDRVMGGRAYPMVGEVKTADGAVLDIFPATLTAKIDLNPGPVLRAGGYAIETARPVKAGEKVAVLIVGDNILSADPADASGQETPWLVIRPAPPGP